MNRKKRILIFIDWFLPGYKAGGPIQSCANLIAHLKNDFDFWVITRDTDYCESEPYGQIRSDVWNKLDDHLQVYYISGPELNFKTLSTAAREVNPDVVFINGIYSLYFSILPLLIAKRIGTVKTVVSVRGMLAPSAINVKGGKKKAFLRLAKLLGIYQKVHFHATNVEEQQHIRHLFGNSQKVIVAPNLPKQHAFQFPSSIHKNVGELRLVSVARISPEKNIKYALEILRDHPYNGTIIFDIHGPIYNERYWPECLEVISSLPANIKVNYKGSLASDKVYDTLMNYHALFMPTCGENFGHIILESFSAGRPVVISDQTPWRELESQSIGFDISLSEPERFANALQLLLDQTQSDYDKCLEAAYIYAKDFVQNKEALKQNFQLFN